MTDDDLPMREDMIIPEIGSYVEYDNQVYEIVHLNLSLRLDRDRLDKVDHHLMLHIQGRWKEKGYTGEVDLL